MEQTINREASDKTKGFRLQKLRALLLILQEFKRGTLDFYIATEHIEDLSLTSFDGGIQEYIEEDKNYDPKTSFTLQSPSVKNTLVSFFDIYCSKGQSPSLKLAFYTTVKLGKEKLTDSLKNLGYGGNGFKIPEGGFLKAIVEKSWDSNILFLFQQVLIEEYKEQHKGKSFQGHLSILENMKEQEIQNFLQVIYWEFGQPDEKGLEESVLKEIRCCKFFNHLHEGKEEFIKARLLDELDLRQNEKDWLKKHISCDKVKLVFIEAKSKEVKNFADDPTEMWDVKENQDKRNLIDKVKGVCPQITSRGLSLLARKVASSKSEEKKWGSKFVPVKCRVWDACEEYLLENPPQAQIGYQDLQDLIEKLTEISFSTLEELKKDYSYPISNKESVKGAILSLVDSCFLAFDEV